MGGSVYQPYDTRNNYALLDGDFYQTDRCSLWCVLELLENFLIQGRVTHVVETDSDNRMETALALSWNL